MKFQAPSGTRDFYPEQMAWRNFLFDVWRRVSIRNGYEQVDGPIYESLALYEVKSGGEMVGQTFRVRHPESDDERYAIRPEFTPTLARMVAERANTLAKPIKWFSLPNVCRAERPQRGRLREHLQWNIDLIGLDSALADAEVIFTAVDAMAALGLGPDQVRVKISHRQTLAHILGKMGISDDKLLEAFELLDRRDKIEPDAFTAAAADLGMDPNCVARFDQTCRLKCQAGDLEPVREQLGMNDDLGELGALDEQLRAFDILDWCEYDLGIVRGFAYYTGTVFEVHETSGVERAVAGGGRYDNLIELFGGPKLSAVGFGMGDVVISLVLADKGLVPEDVSPRPDVFVFAVESGVVAHATQLTARLRRAGLHARCSYRTTRNVGKLLKQADATRARLAVIVGSEIERGVIAVKNLESGEQAEVAIADLVEHVKAGNDL